MVSQQTIDVIKSTVPVLKTYGEVITTCFYKNLFHSHPELLNMFNRGNQQTGKQQKALANTIYAAANYIDQLDTLVPVVTQIAHKHRGLGVKKEHYPIVGEHLLGAIKEVLGDAATDEVIQAWKEAYEAIANIFIEVEAQLYQESQEQPHGWTGFKDFTVVAKEKESSLITSFYLKPTDGSAVPLFLPGQYITVRVNVPKEVYLSNRQYSLSSGPSDDYYRISVKREASQMMGGSVSNYLHQNVEVGNKIEVSAPAGVFNLTEDNTPIAFISGGVGITPMISMLVQLVETKTTREVSFIHATKDCSTHAFKAEVNSLIDHLSNARAFYGYEFNDSKNAHFQGYITLSLLKDVITPDTVCYICGPAPFMKHVICMLKELGLKEEQIQYELFGPAKQLI